MENINVVLRYARRYWRRYRKIGAVITGIVLIDKLFWLYLSYGFKTGVDNLTMDDSATMDRILLLALVQFPLIIAGNIAADRLIALVRTRMANDVRLDLFTHLQKLSMDFYTRAQPGDVAARFVTDLDVVERGISERVVNLTLSILGALVFMAGLFYLNWLLALFTLFLITVSLPLARYLSPRIFEANYFALQTEGQILNHIQENARGQQIVKGYTMEDRLIQDFRRRLERYAPGLARMMFLNALVDRSVLLLLMYGMMLIGGAGVFLVRQSLATSGDVFAFMALLAVLGKDLIVVGQQIEYFNRAASGIRRIGETLDQRPSVTDRSSAEIMPPFSCEIRFERVSFGYDDGAFRLKAIDLTVPRGNRVAIVGSNGSGKSTLLRLLMRFYEVTDGRIAIDGRDIREFSQKSLRKPMGIVFQDAFLFDATIRDNIRLFDERVTDEEVEAAARAAEAHAFILGLPNGYETRAGDAGARLSGGERQRIAIARALLHHPSILLLDEVTASLDAHTAADIHRTLQRLSGQRTVIEVTHDLKRTETADWIYVLHHGCLVEQGSHAFLMEQRGLFYTLWSRQKTPAFPRVKIG